MECGIRYNSTEKKYEVRVLIGGLLYTKLFERSADAATCVERLEEHIQIEMNCQNFKKEVL